MSSISTGVGEHRAGANLVADANGDLFGTTQTGGANSNGTAFEITGSGFVPAATITPTPLPPPKAPSDFTGYGTSDVLLQNGGTVVDWLMNNGLYQSGNVLTTAATGWDVVGTGDFTGSGVSDPLLQNGGTVVDWIMKDGVYQSGNVLTTPRLAGTLSAQATSRAAAPTMFYCRMAAASSIGL